MPSRDAQRGTAALRFAGALAVVTTLAATQEPIVDASATRRPSASRDPYTRGEPTAMARAGIVGYGPFAITRHHGTDDVDPLLANRVLWIETAHFKIGSTLRSYKIPPEPAQKRKIAAELARLRERLPGVPAETKRLDPWLRLHLIAMRAEDTYADFRDRLGCIDEDFPDGGSPVYLSTHFMGIGPYLGQKEKYVLLVTQRHSQFGRYCKRYLGEVFDWPKRWNFGWKEGLFFGTSVDLAGHLRDDTGLHCHLVYNVVQSLCDGYKHFNHETPVWFKCGLAQWYLRRVDPRYNNFDRPPEGKPDARDAWKWRPKTRALVVNDATRPLAELLTWRDYSEFRFADYMVSWSLVDFLLTAKGDDALATFMDTIKQPIGNAGQPPQWQQVLDRQDAALQRAYGLDVATLEAQWRAWVFEHYRKN